MYGERDNVGFIVLKFKEDDRIWGTVCYGDRYINIFPVRHFMFFKRIQFYRQVRELSARIEEN